MNQADLSDMFKKVTKSLYIKCGISWPLVFYSIGYYEDCKNMEEDPDNPEPANEGDTQMEYSCN